MAALEELHERVTARLSTSEIRARRRAVHDGLLARSRTLDGAQFTRLAARDVEDLFDALDREYLEGAVRAALGDVPLRFRLSSRMTRAGGKTSTRGTRDASGRIVASDYEIAVSTTLLFGTFDGEESSATVAGVECASRLEALQRVVEHELVHLVEMLLWRDSSCSRSRFQAIARGLFGHRAHTHALVTPRQRAEEEHGVRVGSRVRFEFEGRVLEGRVNRVTKRATVLVRDPQAPVYSDGERYAKYYVPVDRLRVI